MPTREERLHVLQEQINRLAAWQGQIAVQRALARSNGDIATDDELASESTRLKEQMTGLVDQFLGQLREPGA